MSLFRKKDFGEWQSYYKNNQTLCVEKASWSVYALYRNGEEFSRVFVAGNLLEKDANELMIVLSESHFNI